MDNTIPKEKHYCIAEIFCILLVSLITNAVLKEKKMQSYIIEAFYVFNSVNNPKLKPTFLGKRGWQAAILSAHCLPYRTWELHYASCFAQE